MSEVVRYKTPILALQSDNVQASGGIVEVVKASDYDKLQERADESDSARKYAQSVGSDLVKKLRALRAEKAGVPEAIDAKDFVHRVQSLGQALHMAGLLNDNAEGLSGKVDEIVMLHMGAAMESARGVTIPLGQD